MSNNHRLRILLNTNTPFSYSGYASVAREVYLKIRDEGYPFALSNFFGQAGYVKEIDGVRHYPITNNPFGDDAMVVHSQDFKADITITNQDTFTLDLNYLQQIPRFIPWVPIDHDPVTPGVIERMRVAYRIIACSRFGQKQLQNFGFNSMYIPYTVDTEIFKPLDKKEMRKKYLPALPDDAFVFGMVAANKENPSRKSFQEVLEAFKMFLIKHSNVYLYLNVPIGNPLGFPILEYARVLGIAERVFYNDPYKIFFKYSHKEVAEIINCFDVSMNPSATEGFGLNIVEAQSCGVPVIVNNFGPMPELVKDGETGWIADAGYRQFTQQLSFIKYPKVESLVEKMELGYTADRQKMGEAGRAWVKDNYDSKMIFETKWKPYLQLIEDEVYGDKENIDKKSANT